MAQVLFEMAAVDAALLATVVNGVNVAHTARANRQERTGDFMRGDHGDAV